MSSLSDISSFSDIVLAIERLGVTEVVLPFLLVYVAAFVSLSKVKVFSFGHDDNAEHKNNKKFSSLVAFVVALMVIISHETQTLPGGIDVVDIINETVPQIGLLLVAGLAVFMVVGLFWNKFEIEDLNLGIVLGGIGLIFVVIIFGSALDFWKIPDQLGFLNNPDAQAGVVIIAIFGLVIWFITRDSSEDNEGGMNPLEWLFSGHRIPASTRLGRIKSKR